MGVTLACCPPPRRYCSAGPRIADARPEPALPADEPVAVLLVGEEPDWTISNIPTPRTTSAAAAATALRANLGLALGQRASRPRRRGPPGATQPRGPRAPAGPSGSAAPPPAAAAAALLPAGIATRCAASLARADWILLVRSWGIGGGCTLASSVVTPPRSSFS